MPQHTVSIDFDGRQYSIETGRFAKFANGSVMVRCDDTMVLVTAVAAENADPAKDFLPLQVEYREKTSSAGKFPGGFLKREGRPSDKEILSSRLIDRPIRPMFPKNWRYETQIIATVYSSQIDFDPQTLGAVGASAALMISDIPFHGPISEVRVGRVDGELIVNPSYEQLENSDIDLTVAGTDSSIVMVEGESNEISEDDFLSALEFAHEKIRQLNNLQNQLLALAGKEKREYEDEVIPEEIIAKINEEISSELTEYVHTITTKKERHDRRNELRDKALARLTADYAGSEEYDESLIGKYVETVFSEMEKKAMRSMILDDRKRLDGRGLTDIRPITCEIGLLPRTHGSALFTRGETQSLTSVTLGTKSDEQMVDGLLPAFTQKFMLHYNFPPFCTGEVGRVGGLSRREVGHGNLAERALKKMAPDPAEFPYTIRVVSDILESNGSSSMATVCAGTLALFDAGVPMRKPVAGIAMGLIMENDKVAVLSDILGDEDHLGDMDFKVTGTTEGITACQMDIKIEGLSIDIMRTALAQARDGRMHILGIMKETISEPKEDLSKYAPRFTIIKIPQDTIGMVIGPGGENIRSIVRETGAEINIEEDGTVTIASASQESSLEAVRRIEHTIRKPEEGQSYSAEVKEVREGLGAIMEFLPKRQGLLHISQIAHERVENVSDVLKVGDKVEVKLLEITPEGKFRLSRKALLPRPEGMEPEEERPHHHGGGRSDRGGRDNRGGNRGGGRDRDSRHGSRDRR